MISQTQNRRAAAGLFSRIGLPFGRIGIAWRAAAVAGLVALAGCQETGSDSLGYGPKHMRPIASATQAKMRELGMSPSAPILIRLYKEESIVEVWKEDKAGRYALLQTYDICKWSGKLGPKIKEGDRQAPEGFYTITPGLMNPRSSYHLAFNTGFPNAYDRALGRTGTDLMVHGSCSSRGCYAMTDKNIQDIYALGREAFRGGQRSFQLQAFPFKMTPENLAKHDGDPNMPFWLMLKEGSDHFEVTRQVPKVDVCGRRYVFDASPTDPNTRLDPARDCPILEVPQEISIAVASKRVQDEVATRAIVAELAEKKKRDEDNRARDLMIASFLGAKGKAGEPLPAAAGAPATDAPAGDPATATQIMIASVPIPQAAPGRVPAPVSVAAAEPADDKGAAGWFASVFSFTDSSAAPVTTASVTPAAAPAPTAEPASPAIAGGVPRTVATGAAVAEADATGAGTAPAASTVPAGAAPQVAAAPQAAPSVPAVPAAAPTHPVAAPIAATPPPPGAATTTATVDPNAGAPMTIAPEPAEEKSILAKAWGSLFSTN